MSVRSMTSAQVAARVFERVAGPAGDTLAGVSAAGGAGAGVACRDGCWLGTTRGKVLSRRHMGWVDTAGLGGAAEGGGDMVGGEAEIV